MDMGRILAQSILYLLLSLQVISGSSFYSQSRATVLLPFSSSASHTYHRNNNIDDGGNSDLKFSISKNAFVISKKSDFQRNEEFHHINKRSSSSSGNGCYKPTASSESLAASSDIISSVSSSSNITVVAVVGITS